MKITKKQKKLIIGGIIGAVAVIGGGTALVSFLAKNAGKVITVIPVMDVTQDASWYSFESSSYGSLTANASQEVNLSSEDVVSEIFVSEGDRVSIGDKLLQYDTTLLQLDLESQELAKQTVELQIQGAENDLRRLQNGENINDSGYGPSDLDNGDDEANADMIQNEMNMLATAEDGVGDSLGEEPKSTVESIDKSDTGETETETETETESGSETETETETETEESPMAAIIAHKKLSYKTKYYKGQGTKEDPYVFICRDGAEIRASFMNKVLGYNNSGTSKDKGGFDKDGKGVYATLEIREGDTISGGFIKSVNINGTQKVEEPFAPDVTWTFTSMDGIVKNVPEVPEEEEPETENAWEDDLWEDGDDDGDASMTQEERAAAIKEKQQEIKELKLDLRDAELDVKEAQEKVDSATVKASINGVVMSVGDPAVGQSGNEPFMVITSDKGLYLRGTISEMDLGKVKTGDTITGTSTETGMSFTAEITEISPYPGSSDDMWGYSSTASSSQYPFLAFLAESDGFYEGEYVEYTVSPSGETTEGFYIEKAYVRSESGQSYVYVEGENHRLVQQFVKTGRTIQDIVQIKSGLSENDYIAFPYGNGVREGARTTRNASGDEEESLEDEEGMDVEILDGEEPDAEDLGEDENIDEEFLQEGEDGPGAAIAVPVG